MAELLGHPAEWPASGDGTAAGAGGTAAGELLARHPATTGAVAALLAG